MNKLTVNNIIDNITKLLENNVKFANKSGNLYFESSKVLTDNDTLHLYAFLVIESFVSSTLQKSTLISKFRTYDYTENQALHIIKEKLLNMQDLVDTFKYTCSLVLNTTIKPNTNNLQFSNKLAYTLQDTYKTHEDMRKLIIDFISIALNLPKGSVRYYRNITKVNGLPRYYTPLFGVLDYSIQLQKLQKNTKDAKLVLTKPKLDMFSLKLVESKITEKPRFLAIDIIRLLDLLFKEFSTNSVNSNTSVLGKYIDMFMEKLTGTVTSKLIEYLGYCRYILGIDFKYEFLTKIIISGEYYKYNLMLVKNIKHTSHTLYNEVSKVPESSYINSIIVGKDATANWLNTLDRGNANESIVLLSAFLVYLDKNKDVYKHRTQLKKLTREAIKTMSTKVVQMPIISTRVECIEEQAAIYNNAKRALKLAREDLNETSRFD